MEIIRSRGIYETLEGVVGKESIKLKEKQCLSTTKSMIQKTKMKLKRVK